MSRPGAIMMILAVYFLFVLKIGPDFMRKREAFKLTKTLIVYNGIQVVASAYLVYYVSKLTVEELPLHLVEKIKCYTSTRQDKFFPYSHLYILFQFFMALLRTGLTPKTCYMHDENYRKYVSS